MRGKKIQHLRIDTHENNKVMQHLILKNGFEKCGIIYVDDGSPRVAFEKNHLRKKMKKKIAQNPHMEEKDLKESDNNRCNRDSTYSDILRSKYEASDPNCNTFGCKRNFRYICALYFADSDYF